MILFSHPSPNAIVRHTASALRRAGVLGEIWTCLTGPERSRVHSVPAETFVDREMPDQAAEMNAAELPPPASMASRQAASLDAAMSVRLNAHHFGGVYAYEHGAEASFRAAGRHGLLRIYDLPAGHWRGQHPILVEEAALEPEWAATLAPSTDGGAAAARTEAELRQADLVLVGSTWGLNTIEETFGVSGAIAIVPPTPPETPPITLGARTVPGPLRVLFAGPLGQRAGLSYLFRACRELGPSVALSVIGERPSVECPALERELLAVRWRSRLSAESFYREMAAHDVFVFPAVYDASSPLLLAALAMGLPVIGTPNSAAPDLIRDGCEGYIVPVRSAEAIAEKLNLLRENSDLRAEMGHLARARAGDFTWERFEQTVGSSVAAALGQR